MFRSDFAKNLMQVSPLPMMLHIEYDCNWPTGFRDIHVSEIFMFQRYSCFMFESVKRHTDRRTQAHTDAGSSPNLYAHFVSHQLR